MKKIPLCASCGDSLDMRKKQDSRILIQWEKLKSKPMVGWHGACAELDPLFKAHTHGEDHPGKMITEIGGRGPGRVS